MKIEYETIRVTTTELTPGDRVLLVYDYVPSGFSHIKRLVETCDKTYAVFENGTWRSINTYGKTWWKVGE